MIYYVSQDMLPSAELNLVLFCIKLEDELRSEGITDLYVLWSKETTRPVPVEQDPDLVPQVCWDRAIRAMGC